MVKNHRVSGNSTNHSRLEWRQSSGGGHTTCAEPPADKGAAPVGHAEQAGCSPRLEPAAVSGAEVDKRNPDFTKSGLTEVGLT